MSVELASKVFELEGHVKALKSQAEVYQAQVQELMNQGLAYRTNLHITQKAYQELNQEKVKLETRVKELEDQISKAKHEEKV